MISVVFVFILTFISVLLVVISRSIQFLIPLVFILIVYIIGLIIYRYKRFGISEFRIFQHQKEPVKFSDMILYMLGKIPGYRRIIQNNKMYSDMILIDESGVYLLKMVKYNGSVRGKRTDEQLQNQIGPNRSSNISNPFYLFEQDKLKLRQISSTIEISTILVTNNNCSFIVDNVNQNEVISLQNFYYQMGNVLKDKKILTQEEILKLQEQLNQEY